MTRRHAHNNGFTLVEVIVVIAIMGILGVVIVSSRTDSDANLVGQAEAVKSHLRYAQGRAMSTDSRVWGIVFQGNSYWLFWCDLPPSGGTTCINNNQTALPGTDQTPVSLEDSGITISGISPPRTIIAFDQNGRPYVDNNTICQTLLTSPLTITLQDANGNTAPIQLTQETGFIP